MKSVTYTPDHHTTHRSTTNVLNKLAMRTDLEHQIIKVHTEGRNPNNKIYRGKIKAKILYFCLDSSVHGKLTVRDV
jgi:hypothetical protein